MTRIAIVRKDDCNPISCGKLCGKLCPVNRMGEDCIMFGSDSKAVIDEVLCTGCGICTTRCPFDAIDIINLPAELNSTPIHQFGRNGFHLYSLPTPFFGKVVGILGKNGIGKSTAITILAGLLKPNLGDWENNSFDYDKMLEFFKGSEAQGFFEKVRDGEIVTSYKPQSVETIAKQFSGKVRDLLEKVDQKGKLEELAETLEITTILDNDIKAISGGELQRVAIAATMLKKANLYIFDEPTSYLDIKQRLVVSNLIRSLADEKTAVLVIEHDLIAMDIMADLVHLMYGKETSYGIVSGVKQAKAGINTYLSGYLKEENIRFRDKEIKFDIKEPFTSTKFTKITGWPELNKKLGNFSLDVKPGELMKKEVSGVLGPNGIGKTTFMKLLTGVEKPDSGDVEMNVKISYKPQYIDSTSEELVMNVLKEAEKYDSTIMSPLNLKPLLMKQINQLSGGELQRVAIAEALARDCELVLLDEPSAYLDIEQRLIVAKVIKGFIELQEHSAIIIDHDLLFLDSLSDRLIVFSGEAAVHGTAVGPITMADGMNSLLKEMEITLRRDEMSGRPRINNKNSQKDKEQKSKNSYYYS